MPHLELVALGMAAIAAFSAGAGKGEDPSMPGWECVTKAAAFSPRDTAEGVVFKNKLWLSNGYYHGNVLSRDLWNSEDGETWTRVSEATPYDGYSEMVVFRDQLWAVKSSVWRSSDGLAWERVLEKTPFGTRGYGELIVSKDAMWQLGSGSDVWRSSDGKAWTCVTQSAPYGARVASAVAVFDGKLWLMGGYIDQPNTPPEQTYKQFTTFNDVYCSEDGASWEHVVEHAPWSPRMWMGVAAYAGRLWVLGGFDNRNNTNLGDVWTSTNGRDWVRFDASPCFPARHEPTCYTYRGSLWVVAGNTWPVVNDVWRLTLTPSDPVSELRSVPAA